MIRIYHRRTGHTLGYAGPMEAFRLVARYPEYDYEEAT